MSVVMEVVVVIAEDRDAEVRGGSEVWRKQVLQEMLEGELATSSLSEMERDR